MKPIQCASCFKQSCVGDGHQEKEYCPTYAHPEVFDAAKKIYAEDSETGLLAKHAAVIESKGYMVWPRLKDIIELARRMEFTKIAVLFCPDLGREAKKTCRLLTESGFTVVSRVCGINKSTPQLPEALMSELNESAPEMIVNAGLCSAFEAEALRLSTVPATTFIARDKKLNNNPAAAVYASDKWRDWAKEIYRDKLGLE
ncbi:MAG: DUF1847 domain-containing protein [Proteobacteria bacterium]|nr:DUF1847 domain-containing protein [Pseudomonadota bacterium]